MADNNVNISLQTDEIEALSAIYEDKFLLDSENSFRMKISSEFGREVLLQVSLPDTYPLHSPPVYDISAPWMTRQAKLKLIEEMEDVYRKNKGENMIHLWIATIKDFIDIEDEMKNQETGENEIDRNIPLANVHKESIEIPDIEHGEPIIVKKSVFQAHLARIESESQVPLVIAKLKENGKIAAAAHNTYAYRILCSNGSFNEDFDDDGEKKAGLVLLRALQLSNLSNILIIVSRWFGGILLGPERFRHYNNAATNLVNQFKTSIK